METFLATFLFFAGVMAVMAVGVVVHGRSLKGSCGGPGADCPCDEAAQRDCKLKKHAEAS